MVMSVATGHWGYNRNGELWCTTCGGTGGVPCPEPHTWGEDWWADCSNCDVGLEGQDHDPTAACPDCGVDNPDTYVEGAPMCANCGVTKGICKKHPGVVWNGFTGPWCKACCLTCNPL